MWSGRGRSCTCPGLQAKRVRGQGGTASQRGGQHPPICPAVLRGLQWDTSQLSVLPLLTGWEEPWRWDFSCTTIWTQVRPKTSLQLSPWRHLRSKKTFCCLSAHGELQPFIEKLSREVNTLLLALSFQEVDSQIHLIFSFFSDWAHKVRHLLWRKESCALLFHRPPQHWPHHTAHSVTVLCMSTQQGYCCHIIY